MTTHPDHHEEGSRQRLDEYLDRQMTDAARTRFESDLASDASLRGEVELQHAIDGSLARVIAIPSADALRSIAATAADEVAAGRPRRGFDFASARSRPVIAIAASIALCVSGAWMIWNAMSRDTPEFGGYVAAPRLSFEAMYEQTVEAGFQPQVLCRDATEFENWFVDRFDRPLRLLEELPAETSVLGLGYGHTISESTIHLLVDVEGVQVMVFVDARESAVGFDADLDDGLDDRLDDRLDAGLHRYHREIDGLVMYEISPLETPRVIPFARTPEPEGERTP